MEPRTFITTATVGGGIAATAAIITISAGLLNSSPRVVSGSETFPKLPIGMNLAGISNWAPGFPFRNLFLGSRPWVTRNQSLSGPHDTKDQEAFLYNSDGYPLQVPVSAPGYVELQIVFIYVPNQGTPEVYSLLYDGEGEFDGMFGTVKLISQQPGRAKLRMEQETTIKRS